MSGWQMAKACLNLSREALQGRHGHKGSPQLVVRHKRRYCGRGRPFGVPQVPSCQSTIKTGYTAYIIMVEINSLNCVFNLRKFSTTN